MPRPTKHNPIVMSDDGESADIVIDSATHGRHRIPIDAMDVDRCARGTWNVKCDKKRAPGRQLFVVGRVDGTIVTMGNYLLGVPAGFQVDHVDRNPLNNRRGNLRCTTPAENQWNRPTKGYYYSRALKRWIAKIRVLGVQLYLGCFTSPRWARKAYLAARALYFIIPTRDPATGAVLTA